MKTLNISTGLFFMLLSFSLKSQCIDTNTLLDSIHTIKIIDLNGIKKIIPTDQITRGEQFHTLIAHKIFVNWNDTVPHQGADSIIIPYKKKDYYVHDSFIQVKNDSSTNYKIVIFDMRLDRYLLTLGPSLQLIDHICWYQDGRRISNPINNESTTTGIYSSIKNEKIYQEYYLESAMNGKMVSNEITKRKQYIINNYGKFVLIN